MTKIILLFVLLMLNGCTIVAQYLGASSTTLQLAQTADMAKLTLDAVSSVETGKPVMDHVSGYVLDKDCNSFRLFKGEKICIDKRSNNASVTQ